MSAPIDIIPLFQKAALEVAGKQLQGLTHETVISKLGLDSVAVMELVSYFEEKLEIRMPDLDGPGLYRALRQGGFAGRMILVTGDTLDRSLEALLADASVRLLEKPLMPGEVRRAVADALTQPMGSKT